MLASISFEDGLRLLFVLFKLFFCAFILYELYSRRKLEKEMGGSFHSPWLVIPDQPVANQARDEVEDTNNHPRMEA